MFLLFELVKFPPVYLEAIIEEGCHVDYNSDRSPSTS